MRYCFYTNVKPGKLAEYLDYHDNIWPEVVAGLRTAGVLHLHIWRLPDTNTLVMTIETAGTELAECTGPGSLYRADPRCEEWETMMDAEFHGGWTRLTKVHASDDEWNKALSLPKAERFYEIRPTDAVLEKPTQSGPPSVSGQSRWIDASAGLLCGALLTAALLGMKGH